MLQKHMNSFMNTDRPMDLQGIIMPTADKADWFLSVCLNKIGSSGYPEPGAPMRMLE